MKIRSIIVDDEAHAREGIRLRLSGYPDVDVCGECASGAEAVRMLTAMKPDLVFLDIQLPEGNGFEVLERLTLDPMPLIIFVTAFDEYAIKAFEVHALDYLLKPIGEERFRATLDRVLAEIRRRDQAVYAEAVRKMLMSVAHGEEKVDAVQETGFLSRILVRSKDVVTVVPVEEVVWIESAGDYAVIHTVRGKHILRETLALLEEKLDPQKFVRIHRTAIVRVASIKFLRTNDHGDFDVVVSTGDAMRLGRSYRERFQQVVGRVRG